MNIRLNIKEAKQEVINTVRAYLKKDETGAYEIPPERQRPILLMGPPGIGKTAIMEQVAQECGISLISYTITHHTRQSAIGLPFISKKEYGGEEYSVTEYTMSEIVASVYDQIELSGISEGILFLDEINCVSETLAPTMLQFLQYKMFGNHKVPDGFIIVTAGNPPQYNKSVRDFDIVTLDRVKRIDIEEDFPVWKEYAYQVGIHGAILSYLEIRKKDFYSVKTQMSSICRIRRSRRDSRPTTNCTANTALFTGSRRSWKAQFPRRAQRSGKLPLMRNSVFSAFSLTVLVRSLRLMRRNRGFRRGSWRSSQM